MRSKRSLLVDERLDSSSSIRKGLGVSIASVSSAGATPDVISPTAAIFISFGPFAKSPAVACVPAIPQSPSKRGMEVRCAVWGDRCPPRWLKDGGPGRLAEANLDGSLWQSERARVLVLCSHERQSLDGVPVCLSVCPVSLKDGDLMLISGKMARRRRPLDGRCRHFHQAPVDQGDLTSSSTAPPLPRPRQKLYQLEQGQDILQHTVATVATSAALPIHIPIPIYETHMSGSPPPQHDCHANAAAEGPPE